MALTETPICNFGETALPFRLPDASGRPWTLEDVRGPKGLLIMFICNHCPYVKAIMPKLVRDTQALRVKGVGSVAIMPNDFHAYPDDAPEQMLATSHDWGFEFPYLVDESQAVAKAYGAVCTPDFFGYNAALELHYRGRLDSARAEPDVDDAPRELFIAMQQIAQTGQGPREQSPSMGCSIKWRTY